MHYAESSHRHRGILNPENFEKHVDLRCYKPSPDLAPFIEHCFVARWDLRNQADYIGEDVLTQPAINLFFVEGTAFFNGITPGKRTFRASGKGTYAGVKFKPGGFHPFWPQVLTTAAESSIPATKLFPQADSAFCIALLAHENNQHVVAELESLLRSKQAKPDAKIALIGEIIKTIESDPFECTVVALAAKFHMSERNLQRLFQEYVGIGIKWSIVRARLLAAVGQAHGSTKPNWTSVAADLGYSSQSHLVNDFKRIIGVSPSVYLKSDRVARLPRTRTSFSGTF